MAHIPCHSCRSVERAASPPTRLADFPDGWRPLNDPPGWIPENEPHAILRCERCGGLWTVFWDQRELYFDFAPIPEAFHELLSAQPEPPVFLNALRRLPAVGLVRHRILEAARWRFSRGDLNENVSLLLDFLSDETLPLEVAQEAVRLLETVLSAAVNRHTPDLRLGSPEREALAEKYRERAKEGQGILETARVALADWRGEQTVTPLPPLRNLDPSPVDRWLGVRFPEADPFPVVVFRGLVRQFLEKLAFQARRKPPTVTLAPGGWERLRPFADPNRHFAKVGASLQSLASASECPDPLALADRVYALGRFAKWQFRLDSPTAEAMVSLLERMEGQCPPPSPYLVQWMEQLLRAIPNLDEFPPAVRRRVRWRTSPKSGPKAERRTRMSALRDRLIQWVADGGGHAPEDIRGGLGEVDSKEAERLNWLAELARLEIRKRFARFRSAGPKKMVETLVVGILGQKPDSKMESDIAWAVITWGMALGKIPRDWTPAVPDAKPAKAPQAKSDGRHFPVPGGVFWLSFMDRGRKLLTVGKAVDILDLADGRSLARIDGPTDYGVRDAALSRDGRWLAAATMRTANPRSGPGKNGVHVWDLVAGRRVHEILGLAGHTHFILPDNRTLLVSTAFQGAPGEEIRYDLETGAEIGRRDSGDDIRAVFSDGNRCLVFDPERKLSIRALDGDDRLLVTGYKRPSAFRVVLYPDETRAIVCQGKDIQPVNLETGKTEPQFRKGHTHGAAALAVTPDGRRSVSADGTSVRIYDLESKEQVTFFRRKTGFGSVAVSPDGKTVAAGGRDGAWIWDMPG